jgi:PAS domain S-box-containing protein
VPELHSIYRSAPVGLAVLDTELRFLNINERLAEMNGLSVEAHIGRRVHEVLPGLTEQAERVLRRVLETGEPLHDVEIRGETPAQPGVERVWREQFNPLRDEQGCIVGISVVAEEVTEQRRTLQALRSSQERLNLALDAAGMVVWEWDLQSDALVFAGRDWLGYRGDEQPRTMTALGGLIHPDDLAQASGCIEVHLLGHSDIYEGEYRLRDKDGAYHWVASRGRVTARDVDGQPLRMTGVRRDITQQKQAEDRLRHSQERLDIALQAGRLGVWEWPTGTDLGYWSPLVFELTGLPPTPDGVARNSDFLALIHPDDRPRVDADIARVLERGGDYEAEFRILPADGSGERWLLSRGTVMQGDAGRRSRLVGINMDISARKAMEQALRQADTRRNEFLAMLGHELRNPLAPITNAVRLLERVGDDPDRRLHAVEILRRQSQHMARLVDDLLEVSRITQGRIELRMENILAATPVFAAVESVRPLARERRQTIEVAVPASLDLVADAARLTQIVANLLVNAVKYTPEGGRVWLTVQEQQEQVEITVRDDGMGIRPELLPFIFELFTQGEQALERAQGGLGIGLALVKRLVELHGGSVEVASPGAGRGATFTVRLPRQGRRQEPRASAPVRIPPLPGAG